MTIRERFLFTTAQFRKESLFSVGMAMRREKAWRGSSDWRTAERLSRSIDESIGLRIGMFLCRFVSALQTICIIRSRRLITSVARMIVVMCRCTTAFLHGFYPLRVPPADQPANAARFGFCVDVIWCRPRSAGCQ